MAVPALYPFVALIIHPSKLARSKFGPSGPKGASIYSIDCDDAEEAAASLAKSGSCFHLFIDKAGLITQACYCSHSTWHAGKARWLGQSPNKEHLAIGLLGEPNGAASPAQLASLEQVCLWLMATGVSVADICGAGEAALPRGRRHDPEERLGEAMALFREKLRGSFRPSLRPN